MRFLLPQALKNHMLEHALATPEQEVCGLLASQEQSLLSEVISLYRIPNIATEPTTTFLMQPQAQIAALKTMRRHGEQLCGIYHSHPNSEALPSNRDRQQAAYPGTAYLIISLMASEPYIGSFIYDGESFQTLGLEII